MLVGDCASYQRAYERLLENDERVITESRDGLVVAAENRAQKAEREKLKVVEELEEAEHELELSRAREQALMEVIRVCRWGSDGAMP